MHVVGRIQKMVTQVTQIIANDGAPKHWCSPNEDVLVISKSWLTLGKIQIIDKSKNFLKFYFLPGFQNYFEDPNEFICKKEFLKLLEH